MPQFLLELYSEEIPAGMQTRAAADLERMISDRLKAAGIEPGACRCFATPMRLALVIDDLPARQPDRREERKGPRVGAPEKAMQGFLKSVGLTQDQLATRSDKKGEFYLAVTDQKGRPTAEILAEIVPDVVRTFQWPKAMRWGSGTLRWVRPLHAILCVFDGKVVPFEVDGIVSGNTTKGHRFLAPEQITVDSFADYEKKLTQAKVILDVAARKTLISAAADKLAKQEGFELAADDDLLNETAGLVEWPVVQMGSIDENFVKPVDQGGLPREVLTSAMAKHQKYFSVRLANSSDLAPHFIVVSNLEADDGGAQMIAGNERVLRARLSDAKFFWDRDRKKKLKQRVGDLEQVIFHAKLGTLRDKILRNEQIASEIAESINVDVLLAKTAASLAKADLTTEMVGEFADLQGVMGRYYALADGEDPKVAQAIAEHYSPQGPADMCPSAGVSIAVAIADKIDSLVGFFGIDEKPTGSKDPYALRRAALGIIRLILENDLRLRLRALLTSAMSRYNERSSLSIDAETVDVLLEFFADRLKVYLKDKGIRHDLIDAVFALPGQDDLKLIVQRVTALQSFLDTEDGANLLTAYKRARNILRIEEKKDKVAYLGRASADLFNQPEEQKLHEAIMAAVPEALRLTEDEDFQAAMAAMAKLRSPVDAFFDKVKVNTDDKKLRRNRLLLLSQIRSALESVADFSKIEG